MKPVVIADDHPMCRQATRLALAGMAADHEVIEVGTMQAALEAAPSAKAIILDLMLPDMWGLAGLLDICSSDDAPRVLVVTGHDDPVYESLAQAAGASGFVSKNAELAELTQAAEAVLAGETWFSEDQRLRAAELERPGAAGDDPDPRGRPLADRLMALSKAERRVLAALSDGSLNKQIAHKLDLSEITVKQHIKAILRKTGAANRTQAALLVQLFADQSKLQDAFERGTVAGVTLDG